MVTDDGDFFGVTEEQEFQDWLDWAEQLVTVISIASQRVSLAIAAGGFAFAGATLIGKSETLGQLSLGVAGVFAIWLAVATAKGVSAKR